MRISWTHHVPAIPFHPCVRWRCRQHAQAIEVIGIAVDIVHWPSSSPGAARHSIKPAGDSPRVASSSSTTLMAEEAYSIGDTLEIALSRAADPVTRQHRSEIASADGLLVVHPNWWGKPPAILAGWLDRILVPGVAYRLASADGLPEGLLSIKNALIFNTSDTHAERETTELGDPLELIWGRCVLPYCSVETYHQHVFRPVVGSSDEQRKSWLEEAEGLSRRVFQSGS